MFQSAVTQIAFTVQIDLPSNTTAGGTIVIAATAADGNDLTETAQDSLFLKNADALTVRIIRPSEGAVASPGLQIPVELVAAQRTGVTRVGYVVSGVVTDSVAINSFSAPLPDTVMFVDTLDIPSGTPDGTFDIMGFAIDSTGRVGLSSPVAVTVQSVTNDTDPPVVSFQIGKRVEVSDSITVRATDPSGITQIGWSAALLDGTLVASGTTAFGGTLTEVSETYGLEFAFTTFPQTLEISATATDVAGNSGEATVETVVGSPIRRDTVIVVNGLTRPLPAGGSVVDAVYNRNLNEVYLTNVVLGRIEVFRIADTSFVPGGIPVGARPWGIALWPRDADGTNADTVVVANSGGTDLSIVDLQLRREVRRHSLPNFIVDQVTTKLSETGVIQLQFIRHDFSDRPQYLGMTCRPGVGPCAADQIIAVYSTTPTVDQDNLPLRGSVRWENLTSATPSSHFFWEHAEVPPSPDFDTLRVFVDRGPTVPLDTILATACGRMVDIDKLVFRDTTFVRNSGDFTHALIGEGGVVAGEDFAQAVGFNVTTGVATTTCSGTIAVGDTTLPFTGPVEEDLGITRSFRVSDFISNTATTVSSIAINFNGLTNLIRTVDSAYVLGESLRLKGLISERGPNPGMDLNFDHSFEAGIGGTTGTFGGSGNPDDRLVFLASDGPQIQIYDTFFFDKVATVPIRDPIIGSLRVARLPTGEQVLVGVTSRGVVTVRLPAIINPFPTGTPGGTQR